MIQKVIKKRKLDELPTNDNLLFWQSRSPAERISAVELLRRQYHGSTIRLQRSICIIERTQR